MKTVDVYRPALVPVFVLLTSGADCRRSNYRWLPDFPFDPSGCKGIVLVPLSRGNIAWRGISE
jgi:hypothetical protein